MSRKTAHDFDQDLLALFDAYVHGAIDRRTFLDKAGKFAVAGVTAMMLLEQLSPNFAAQVVSARTSGSGRSILSMLRLRATARPAGTSSIRGQRKESFRASS